MPRSQNMINDDYSYLDDLGGGLSDELGGGLSDLSDSHTSIRPIKENRSPVSQQEDGGRPPQSEGLGVMITSCAIEYIDSSNVHKKAIILKAK